MQNSGIEFQCKLRTIGKYDVLRWVNPVTTLMRLLIMREGMPAGVEDTGEVTELSAVPKQWVDQFKETIKA